MPSRSDFATGREYDAATTEEFRANGGKVTGDFAGKNILLLTTTGAKSGKEHITPLGFSLDGERIVVSAANGGAQKHPHWYLNLVANPEVTVEVLEEKFTARAVPSEGDEYDRLVIARSKTNPRFLENQARTTRRIPLVWLERIS